MDDIVIGYLQGRANDLDRQLKRHREQVQYHQTQAEQCSIDIKKLLDSVEVLMRRPDAPQNGSPGASPGSIREEAYKILKKNFKPMSKAQIYEELKRHGLIVGGQMPLQNLSAHLSNDSRIEVVGDGVWGLTEWRSQAKKPSNVGQFSESLN